MAVASPQMLIADLRRWLARMESHARASATVLPFDIAEVDAHVPGGGLQLGQLRDHYGADGKDLSERINQASKRLPSGASAAALHRLSKLANAILHLDSEKDEGLPKIDPIQLEKEIVSFLFVLRALIEGAPQWRAR